MNQSKLHSIAEAVTNTAIGYIVACLTQAVVFPLFEIHITAVDNLKIGIIFTIVSLVRSYLLRRLFNRWHSVGHTTSIQVTSKERLFRNA